MIPKKLIVGLGNLGEKYEHTRHNLGFRILGQIAKSRGVEFEKKAKLEAEITAITYGDQETLLVKPRTLMNESGRAVAGIVNFYKINFSDLLVVHDEIDLPLGTVRMGTGGSAGHKGVESIIKALGPGFARLRIGIENRKEFRIPDTESYILQNFTDQEEKVLQEEVIPGTLAEIEKFCKLKITPSQSPP